MQPAMQESSQAAEAPRLPKGGAMESIASAEGRQPRRADRRGAEPQSAGFVGKSRESGIDYFL